MLLDLIQKPCNVSKYFEIAGYIDEQEPTGVSKTPAQRTFVSEEH